MCCERSLAEIETAILQINCSYLRKKSCIRRNSQGTHQAYYGKARRRGPDRGSRHRDSTRNHPPISRVDSQRNTTKELFVVPLIDGFTRETDGLCWYWCLYA